MAETSTNGSPAAASQHRVGYGIFFMMLGVSFFPFMNGTVQVLSERYASDQIIWARVTSHLVFMLALILPRHGLGVFRSSQLGSQIKRSAAQLMSTTFYFSSVKYLGLAQATAISFMTPFFVAAIAWPILGERLSRHRLISMMIAFLGVMLIIRPGTSVFHWASIGILCSALFYGTYQVYTRGVASTDHPNTSVIYSVLMASLVMSIIMLFRWKPLESWRDAGLMMWLGVCGGLGHWCLAKAMTYAPANVVAPFQYWQLIGAVLVGFWVSGQWPDTLTWVGAGIIVAAGLYLGWRDTRSSSSKPAA